MSRAFPFHADVHSEESHIADLGSIFGIGFPPFRGGPFRLVDSMGSSAFVSMMLKYRDALGAQFTPAPILVDYAKTNKKFHA